MKFEKFLALIASNKEFEKKEAKGELDDDESDAVAGGGLCFASLWVKAQTARSIFKMLTARLFQKGAKMPPRGIFIKFTLQNLKFS